MQIKTKITALSMLCVAEWERSVEGAVTFNPPFLCDSEALHLGDRELKIFQHICDFYFGFTFRYVMAYLKFGVHGV